MSCSTKPCSLLRISTTGTYRYYQLPKIYWLRAKKYRFPADLTLQKFLFNINRHNIVWGGGGERGGMVDFFSLWGREGEVPFRGLFLKWFLKTKYRYIDRAISSLIIKLWLDPAYQWFLVKQSLYTHHSHYISSLLI